MEQPNGEPEEILLENLEKEYYRLSFLTDTGSVHLKKELEISKKAGDIIGEIYIIWTALRASCFCKLWELTNGE